MTEFEKLEYQVGKYFNPKGLEIYLQNNSEEDYYTVHVYSKGSDTPDMYDVPVLETSKDIIDYLKSTNPELFL